MTIINNKNFYPTPSLLISRMCGKVKNRHPEYILEPSAGKGDIVEYITSNREGGLGYGRKSIKAIEIDRELAAILRDRDIEVIDSDFLNYNGGDIFDLIIMNPPFDNGDRHLLKAIDLLYSGEIVCLLNAETIRNAHTHLRKELCSKLAELKASIEYIQNAFISAERPTGVEIALIHIEVKRDIEEDLFKGASDTIKEEKLTLDQEEQANIATNDPIQSMVDQYLQQKNVGLKTIMDYYKNFKVIGDFIRLSVSGSDSTENLYNSMQMHVNTFNNKLRKHYWDKALGLRMITEKMTSANRERFYSQLRQHSHLDFTANNVRSFIINLIGSYEQTLLDAAVAMFDNFTRKWSYYSDCDKNRLHFSSWKTNEAFKVAKKIIIPCNHYCRWGEPFKRSYSNYYELDRGVMEFLCDVDKVLNSLAGYTDYMGIGEAVSIRMNQMKTNDGNLDNRNISSTFFEKVTFYKKGTLHLTFKDDDLLRKFNLMACKSKNWLPDDYGQKAYNDCAAQDKETINSFEGKESYTRNLNNPAVFAQRNNMLMIGNDAFQQDIAC